MPERVTAHASPVIGERARAKPPVTTERIRILPKADRIPADPVVEKVDYDRAVAEAKQIVGQVEKSEERLMRVGELAHKIEKDHGPHKFKKFAKDIGKAPCTLKRWLSTYRAWVEAPAPPKCWSVAQDLQAHPRRFDLIRQHPEMTKSEARKMMRQFKKEQAQANPASHLRENMKRWWRAFNQHLSEVLRDVAMADGDLSPELRQILRETIDPMSRTPRDTAEGLIKFSKFAEGLFADEEPREQLSTEAEPPEQLSTEVESRGELPGQEAA